MVVVPRTLDWTVRLLGFLVPVLSTAFFLTRWALVSEGFFWYLVLVGFGAGLLLRSWRALVLAPAVNLASWVVPVIVQDRQLFGDDFTLVSGTFVVLALHVLPAISAGLGAWAGKAIETRIAPRAGQH